MNKKLRTNFSRRRKNKEEEKSKCLKFILAERGSRGNDVELSSLSARALGKALHAITDCALDKYPMTKTRETNKNQNVLMRNSFMNC